MTYRLSAVRVFTCDFDAALNFYRDTIGLRAEVEDPGSGFAMFDTGPTKLLLEFIARDDEEASELVPRNLAASLEVPNINDTFDRLSEREVEFIGEPEKQPWGGTLAHFKDPDGNIVTLVELPESA